MVKINEINNDTDLAFLLFHHAEEIEGTTELQKLFFLLQEETDFDEVYEDVCFEFEPYKYGPFSEQIYDELELLIGWGVLEEVELDNVDEIREEEDRSSHAGMRFRLTEQGRKAAEEVNRTLDDEVETQFEEVVNKYADMENEELLEYVYNQYPQYTTKSLIREEILES